MTVQGCHAAQSASALPRYVSVACSRSGAGLGLRSGAGFSGPAGRSNIWSMMGEAAASRALDIDVMNPAGRLGPMAEAAL